MEFLLKAILFVHVVAGAITLIAGPLAILFNFKQVRNHKLAGRVFYVAMLFACFSSVLGYIKKPDQVFYQFLLCIAIIVWGGMMRGVRSVMLMRGGKAKTFDWVYTAVLGVTGLVMLGNALVLFLTKTNIAFPILFGVFGIGALSDCLKNVRAYSASEHKSRTFWLQLHLQSMLGAFIASTTAFTVNTGHFLPWWAQWFGPTILLVPVIFHFSKKVERLSVQNQKDALQAGEQK